jgi:hypothetical protein
MSYQNENKNLFKFQNSSKDSIKARFILSSTSSTSSFPTIERRAIFYSLGVAFVILGISSLVIFHFGIISACIIIVLGAEIKLGAEIIQLSNQDVEDFQKRDCGSLYVTSISAIVIASLELLISVILIILSLTNSYLFNRKYYPSPDFPTPNGSVICSTGCLRIFSYDITSFPYTYSFLYYNLGATLFDSIIKISFCSLFLYISKKRRSKHSQSQSHGQGQSQGQGSKRLLDYTHSQRFIQPNQPTLLDTGSVLYSLGVLMLSLGIITLVIVNFGFISSCILIVIGDMWMKAIKNQTDNMSLTERRGLFSLNSLAITGIVLTSLEFVISIILISYSYHPNLPYDYGITCPNSCQCSSLQRLYQFADFCSYNLGVSLITTVTKIILFWFTLHLTKTSSTSVGDDIYEQEIRNNNKVKEGTALLASTTTTTTTTTTTPSQTRIGTTTALIGVRNNTI